MAFALKLGKTALAEVLLPSGRIADTLAFFVDVLGFRVETIFPAEEPEVASLSGHGMRLRLSPDGGEPGVIRVLCDDPQAIQESPLVAPNGTRIELVEKDPPVILPPIRPTFVLTRRHGGPAEGAGRAGMIYRDLIPDRQGGRFIASHITLPEGGPVADWVHFHKIRFQMIFCRQGWARLAYEDQGPPFIMAAGDCVLQPPRIRHRVLESSPGFEVVEIGCPALHETLADHDMALPTGQRLPDRNFDGQVFLHHVAADTPWVAHDDTGFERRDTGISMATGGLADAYVLRPAGSDMLAIPAHGAELLFGFVLDGSAVLEQQGDHPLSPCDAFVIPAGEDWALRESSKDFAVLQVVVAASRSEAT
jgi:uncharacterized protein YjlB